MSTMNTSREEYVHYLGTINAVIDDTDTANIFVIGDWNANPNSNSLFDSIKDIIFCQYFFFSDCLFLANVNDASKYSFEPSSSCNLLTLSLYDY